MTDTVLIRVAARTVPQGKVEVARELRERLKDALDAQAASLAPAVAGASGAGPERIAGQASLTSLSDAVPQQPEPPAD